MMKVKYTFTLLIVAFFSITSLMAQRAVKGTVTDGANKEPLVGASVSIKGTTKGALTDINGQYSIDLPKDAATLVFTFVGYDPREVIVGDATTLDVALVSGTSLENIVVIGSRNATRTRIETAVPVDVIPVSQVVNEVGQVDLNQILTYVAPSFQSSRQAISDGTDHIDPAQLRGLGPDQVLVLINGKRRHQSALVNVNGTVNRGTVGTDLNAIPANAIDRIEILRDGAAAQYGSDAIAGVINIVLKRKAGLSANVSAGQYSTNYEKNYAWNKLYPTNQLPATTSINDGQTLQGSLNYGFHIGEKGYLNVTGEYVKRGATNRTGLYTGQVWPSVSGADRSDSLNTAKGLTRETFDMRIGNSEVTSGGIMANLSLPINDNVEIYAFGGYNNKKGNSAGFYRYPNAVPAAARAKVFTIYPNGFLPNINTTVTDISGAVGIRGKLGTWNADLSETYGQNKLAYNISNSVNYTQATDTTFGGALQTAFEAGSSTFSQMTTNFDISKNHNVLSGLSTAFGAEYRIDKFGITAGEETSWKNYNVKSGVAAGSQVFSGFLPANAGSFSRNSYAFYTDNELDVTKKLMFGAALRYEKYSDFGNTFNYKLVGRYKIDESFSLRASHSTGFRAPSQQQKYYAKTNTLFINIAGVQTPVESGTFTNDSKVAGLVGIPKLKEETSKSYTIGATARQGGMEVTVDLYQINIKDRIVLTNNFDATKFPDATLKDAVIATNATVVNFFTNAVDTRARGIESVISYDWKISGKQNLRFVLAGTFTKNEVLDSADVVDGNTTRSAYVKTSDILKKNNQVPFYFNREDESRMEVAAPHSKVSLTLNYKYDKFTVMLRNVRFSEVVFLDATINPANPATFTTNAFNAGTKETLDQTFSPKIVTDLTLGYQVTKQINVSLGANNLLDVYQDAHTHSGNASAGRFVYSRRVQQMGFNGRYIFGRLTFKL